MFSLYRVQYSLVTVLLLGYQSVLSQSILLPVEVIGPSGYTAAVRFEINDSVGIDYLYLQVHRPSYRDALVNPERGAKASVRLNRGEWIALTNETVEVEEPAASYGGLGGGFHTIEMKVPVNGAQSGTNTLRFRFNGTDGFTSGYRVLAFNLLRGEAPVLADSMFVADDPATWTAPLDNAEDIAQGKVLWDSKELRESPLVDNFQQATCGDCHARDGRDLKYFNYSNWSIEERAKFHGLSQREAEQIASYIRSLDVSSPKQARPWNPPYQPGPGLDSQPVAKWAAGAGLDAVLAKDEDMLPYLYPQGTSSQEAINQTIDIKKTINVRETPVPLQLPDWNEWLPDLYAADIWADFERSGPYQTYRQTLDTLRNGGAQRAIADKSLATINTNFRKAVNNFVGVSRGPQPCVKYYEGSRSSNRIDALAADNPCEYTLINVNKWHAVKQWEMAQEFRLEEAADEIYPYGEVRGWVGKERGVFDVAAHRSADNSRYFVFQTKGLGSYHSAAWYHLQMILNAGHRTATTFLPQDWFYTPNYVAHTAVDNEVSLGNMSTLVHLKMYQSLDTRGPDGLGEDTGPGKDGWYLPFVIPWRFESIRHENHLRGIPWNSLDTYQSGLRAKVTGAFLRQFLDKMKTYPVDSLPRIEKGDSPASAYDSVNTIPKPYQKGEYSYYSGPGVSRHATAIYRTIPRFVEMGMDPVLLNEYIDWCKAVWPKGDWDTLRPEMPTSDESIVIRARGDCGEEVMELRLNGDSVASWTVDTVMSDYVYAGFGEGQVSVHFINDEFRPGQEGCEDRNLTVDYLEVCGTRYQTEEVATETANCCLYDKEKLYTHGNFDFGSLGCHEASSSNVGLLVRAKGSTGAVSGSWGEGEGFEAYPNPATELLNVVGSNDYEAVLYDLVGRVTLRHTHLQGQVQIDVSHIRPGVYTLELHDAQHHYQQKIIIE